ncbi:hypothetical protein BDV95DRAFT_480991 [Massariosphaeria phaeospora]|uniref:Zn(2)-C6 fungal-type domain-containing protein n=1 Tax=Massariosphaeria phaeospora TaxID=100035 RepID=A0A7C8IIG5_9PLEO|nr:hypothetical protein BDV95DRAFT_480991 [Massariosphaeria phaeospora]
METTTATERVIYSKRKSIRRVPLACIQCRLRKVRCDATQPACMRCQTDEKQCEYHKSRRGGRPRRPLALSLQSTVEDPPSSEVSPQWVETLSTATDSNSSGLGSAASSSHSVSDLFEIIASIDSFTFGGTHLRSTQVDQLLTQYYAYFHASHPCVLPRWSLLLKLTDCSDARDFLLPVLLYIGSIFTHTVDTAPLAGAAQQAIEQGRNRAGSTGPFYIQALTLYSIGVYWSNEPERGRTLLNEAIRGAVAPGMQKADYAAQHGSGDPVLEESWRRTWWTIYITDAHIAGSTHSFPTQTAQVKITTKLPCEEHLYESGNIPPPSTLRDYDMREFTDTEFSSFAQLIGFTHGINRVLATRRLLDTENAKVVCANADTMMTAWCSLLPRSKKRLLRDDGSVDELLFKANILMHTYIVDLHRSLSTLSFFPIESISKCAPPPPPTTLHLLTPDTDADADAATHTAKALHAISKLHALLTLPTRFSTHTPFIICMIANMTIAHLSACHYLFREPQLAHEREKIRLNMGVLKMLGEWWPSGEREYRDLGVVAREILGLRDEEVVVVGEVGMAGGGLELGLGWEFDVDWTCDGFGSLGEGFGLDLRST